MKVKSWIETCATRISDPAIHFAPRVPEDTLRAARRSFARGSEDEEALLLIDTGVASWWRARTGLLLTGANIYAQAKGEPPLKLALAELSGVRLSERGSPSETVGGLAPAQSSCSVYLNERLALVLQPNRVGDILEPLEQLLRVMTTLCNPEVALRESLVVSICWACGELTLRPLMVIEWPEPHGEDEFPPGRQPHAALMRCETCLRVQLDQRAGSGKGGAYAFDAADSAVLIQAAASCPDPLAITCACPVHASLRSLPPWPPHVDRYPDRCMYDLPKLCVTVIDGLPQIHLRTGQVQTHYSNGQPKAEGDLRAGAPAGRWQLWHENGAHKSDGNYEDGRRTGAWQQWNERGALLCDELYEQGGRVKTIWRPEAEIAEALQRPSCLVCYSSRLDIAIVLERSGIPLDREGHQIVYSHDVVVRCVDCGAAQLDLRRHDCFDFEEVYEQSATYALDTAGAATLTEGVKRCPDRLSAACRCAVHRSMRQVAQAAAGRNGL